MKLALLSAVCLATTFATAQINPGLPHPPAGAIVFNQIEQMSGWQSCHDPGCAGGSGNGSYWLAQNQSQPSLSGASNQVYNSGVWANALWWKKVGANNNVTNFLWDFWVQLDGNAAGAAQALEYDAFQFVGGYNYMIGSQCNVAAGVWDLWDELNGHWIHSTIPCHGFAAGTWHHIQWYMTTNHTNQTYRYVTLVVDGVPHTINKTYNAKNLHWGDNLGCQFQLDVNASGTGYSEWYDNVTLTVW